MAMKRRAFLKTAGTLAAGSVLIGGGGIEYIKKVEPAWVDVHTIPLRLPRLAPAFHGYRIAQISDLHVDHTFMDGARLSELVDLLNGQKPDVIVITGDFVTNWNSPFEHLAPLQRLRAHDGIFAVLGNHDHWSGADRLRPQLQSYGIRELNDALYTLRRGDAMLHLLGLDDLWPESDYIAPSGRTGTDCSAWRLNYPKKVRPSCSSMSQILPISQPPFSALISNSPAILTAARCAYRYMA